MTSRRSVQYQIGDLIFRTKKDAEAHVQEILYRATEGRPLGDEDAATIRDLLQRHPERDKKVGVGVASIHVRRESEWRTTRHFVVVRTDGTSTDFSFKKCLTPTPPLQLFKQACRHTVADQIIQCRDSALEAAQEAELRCPVLGIVIAREEIHVDHEPPWTFDRLVLAFIKQEQVDIHSVRITGLGDNEKRKGFEDVALRERWQEYHRVNARLRVVSRKANLSDIRRAANDISDEVSGQQELG